MAPARRRERRLRERGRPAWATVLGTQERPGGDLRLRLRVEPGDDDPFEARGDLTAEHRAGPVAAGARVEVLHLGRRGPVLPIGAPVAPPAPDPPPAGGPPAPGVGELLRALARAAADGSLAEGRPIIVEGPGEGPRAGDGGRGTS